MVSKRKLNMNLQGETMETSEESISWSQVMEEAAAATALSGARRSRNRYVGVRQRPSGRWVAEIKDTIQKIRMWLGTYDTAEEAARAYDEAACLLRGANTRTNFCPSSSSSSQSYSSPALPPKITKLLLTRLKERNVNSPATKPPVSANETELGDETLIDSGINASCDSVSATTTNSAMDFGYYTIDWLDTSETSMDNVVENERNVKQEVMEGEEEKEIEMGPVDFGFVDDLLGKSCYCSPFEIAEEIMKPMENSEEQYGDDDIIETIMRKYERTFSASLYAFNGVSECLKLKSGLENKKQEENKDGFKEEVGTPIGCCCFSSSSCCERKESGSEYLSVWSPPFTSLDDLSPFSFNVM